jgi:hypothetical protein
MGPRSHSWISRRPRGVVLVSAGGLPPGQATAYFGAAPREIAVPERDDRVDAPDRDQRRVRCPRVSQHDETVMQARGAELDD